MASDINRKEFHSLDYDDMNGNGWGGAYGEGKGFIGSGAGCWAGMGGIDYDGCGEPCSLLGVGGLSCQGYGDYFAIREGV